VSLIIINDTGNDKTLEYIILFTDRVMSWKRWELWISNNKKLFACEKIALRFEI